MSRNYDNWERLVNAVLLREELRRIGRQDSLSSISSSSSSVFSAWSSFSESDPPLLNSSSYQGISFSYRQIALATNLFSDENLIKRGHSGDLFKGELIGLGPVVVKRILQAFSIELDFFSRISHHSRFVPLLGQCWDGADMEKFLVYEYLPDRDLSSRSLASLDWITRSKIARGVAEGLAYLHHQCNPPLVLLSIGMYKPVAYFLIIILKSGLEA